jgi:cytochrome c oxidase subunit 3
MAEAAPLHEPFPTLERQREAGQFGMFVFLATEVLLFGGIFVASLVLRVEHGAEYAAASREMHYWIGGINTAVLLTSSLLVALMVQAVRTGCARLAAWLTVGAIALGLVFIVLKFTEYALEYRDGLVPGLSGRALHGGPRELFMNLYFAGTGLHAVHVTIGLVLLGSLVWPLGAARRDRTAGLAGNVALYWHLVDVVWIFLYPTLYLAR